LNLKNNEANEPAKGAVGDAISNMSTPLNE